MPLNRRQVVTAGAAIGGAALMTANAEGQFQGAQPAPVAERAEASGKVTLYGEGGSPYFALSEMPEGIETFGVPPASNPDRLGRLLLTAAEKGWVVHVAYYRFENGSGGNVFDVRVENFQAG